MIIMHNKWQYYSPLLIVFALTAALRNACAAPIMISEEALVTKITRYLHEQLLTKPDHLITDYVCELQAFIPYFTHYQWNTIRPLLLKKLDTEITYYQKRKNYWLDVEEIRSGLGLITIGIFSGIGAAVCDDFLYESIRRESALLKAQFQISEKLEIDPFDSRKKTVVFSINTGQPSAARQAALKRCVELWKKKQHMSPQQILPCFMLLTTGMTAFIAIYAGLVTLGQSIKNPRYRERYETLCLFKRLIAEIDGFDQYQYPTPLIVDLDFFA